jgi:hypothetical protein
MCPLCISTAAMIAAGTTSAGVLGLVAVKFRALLRRRREPRTSQTESIRSK